MDYYGLVKTVRTETVEYSFEDGKPKHSKRKLDSIEQFDHHGRLLEEMHYGSDGKILWREQHAYSSGRLIETTVKHDKFIFLPDRRVYKYDTRQNLIEENGYDLSGKLVNQSTYVYDTNNRKIQWTSVSFHPEEHSTPHRWTYSYDEQGRLKEEKAFSDEGNGFIPVDSLGAPHKRVLGYQNGDKWNAALYFDVTGALVRMTLLTYDQKENEIEDIEYNQDLNLKKKIRYEYKFDKHENWVKMKTYVWKAKDSRAFYQLDEVTYQVITYYKN